MQFSSEHRSIWPFSELCVRSQPMALANWLPDQWWDASEARESEYARTTHKAL
jgi:hypothetical protein